MPVSGAKNSALKLMAATLLAPGKTTLQNVPDISDVHVMGKVLKGMGATIDVLDEHTDQGQQLLPQVHVQGGPLVAFDPALFLPAVHPALGQEMFIRDRARRSSCRPRARAMRSAA